MRHAKVETATRTIDTIIINARGEWRGGREGEWRRGRGPPTERLKLATLAIIVVVWPITHESNANMLYHVVGSMCVLLINIPFTYTPGIYNII